MLCFECTAMMYLSIELTSLTIELIRHCQMRVRLVTCCTNDSHQRAEPLCYSSQPPSSCNFWPPRIVGITPPLAARLRDFCSCLQALVVSMGFNGFNSLYLMVSASLLAFCPFYFLDAWPGKYRTFLL